VTHVLTDYNRFQLTWNNLEKLNNRHLLRSHTTRSDAGTYYVTLVVGGLCTQEAMNTLVSKKMRLNAGGAIHTRDG